MSGAALNDGSLALTFISYARVDKAPVTDMVSLLGDMQMEVWIDVSDIRPAAEWLLEIEVAIDRSRAFVAFLSDSYCKSETCQHEMQWARDSGKVVIPVVLGPFTLPERLAWARSLNWIDATSSDKSATAALKIVEAASADLNWNDAHARLLLKAREWDNAGRRGSRLLRGDDLTAAQGALSVARPPTQPQPIQLQHDYVAASRRARRNRTVTISSVGVIVTTVSVVLASIAVIKAGDATRERSHALELLAEAQARQLSTIALSERDPVTATFFALEAEYRTTEPLPEAREAWVKATYALSSAGVIDAGGVKVPFVVDQAQWNPRQALLAVASAEGGVHLYDTAGTETVMIPSDPGSAINWSPDGELIAVDSTLYGIDGAQHSAATGINHFLGWDPTGELFVAATEDNLIGVFDTSGQQVSAAMSVERPENADLRSAVVFYRAYWSPDGSHFVVPYNMNIGDAGGWDGFRVFRRDGTPSSDAIEPATGYSITSWNSTSEVFAAELEPQGTVQFIDTAGEPTLQQPLDVSAFGTGQTAWSPVEDKLAVETPGGGLQLFDREGTLVARTEGRGDGSANDIGPLGPGWSPDGELIAEVRRDGAIVVFDKSGVSVGEPFTTDDVSGVRSLSWAPESDVVAVVTNGGAMRLLKVTSPGAAIPGPSEGYPQIAWSSTGEVAVGDSTQNLVRLFDRTGKEKGVIQQPQSDLISYAGVSDVEWNPQGSLLAVATADGALRLYDSDGKERAELIELLPNAFYSDLQWNSEGSRIVDSDQFSSFVVYDANGENVTPEYAQPSTSSVAWTWGEGTDLAVGGDDGSVALLRADGTTAWIQTFEGGAVMLLQWHEQAALLAVAFEDGTIRLLDTDGRQVGRTFDGARGVDFWSWQLAWNPTGETIATVNSNDEVVLYSATGEQIGDPWPSGFGDVGELGWNPAGTLLAVVEGGFLRLIDPSTPYSDRLIETGVTGFAGWWPDGDAFVRILPNMSVEIDLAWSEADVCTYMKSIFTTERMDELSSAAGTTSRCAHDATLHGLVPIPSSVRDHP